MLDQSDIKEAQENVSSYITQGLLRKAPEERLVEAIFLKNGKESLRVAERVYKENVSDLWAIVCAYYSMYYYANAVLMKFGYKVGDKIVHKVTSDALIVFVRGKLKKSLLENYEAVKEEALGIAGIRADEIIESFELERKKRGLIQYRTMEAEKRSKAKTSLERAREFNREMEKLLAG
jgi:uncharacterized protein (UPF0332 family)